MEATVIIPTRDRPDLLALTLQTVLWQEGVETEILVVDDGTEPGTAELVRQVGDNRVRLLRNSGPRGVSGARNTGIAAALDCGSPSWTTTICGLHASWPRSFVQEKRSGAAWVTPVTLPSTKSCV
jgi:glycosyltransferase involved in cell wall biosynthesis